jgi:hypothetical protein
LGASAEGNVCEDVVVSARCDVQHSGGNVLGVFLPKLGVCVAVAVVSLIADQYVAAFECNQECFWSSKERGGIMRRLRYSLAADEEKVMQSRRSVVSQVKRRT